MKLSSEGYARLLSWKNLAKGSPAQKKALEILENSRTMTLAQSYNPYLIGTFPLDIQIETSDFDIACHALDLDKFTSEMTRVFNTYEGFNSKKMSRRGLEARLVKFKFENHEFELFAQTIPIYDQQGYRHLEIEYRFLQLFKEPFKKKVIDLKLKGIKTEPAFCQILEIAGDPYESLYELSWLKDSELLKRVKPCTLGS